MTMTLIGDAVVGNRQWYARCDEDSGGNTPEHNGTRIDTLEM